jgi:hypothetical protein
MAAIHSSANSWELTGKFYINDYVVFSINRSLEARKGGNKATLYIS